MVNNWTDGLIASRGLGFNTSLIVSEAYDFSTIPCLLKKYICKCKNIYTDTDIFIHMYSCMYMYLYVYKYIPQCGWPLKTLCKLKEARHKRIHDGWFYLYIMSKIGKPVKIENRLVVAWSWRWEWVLTVVGQEESSWGVGNVLMDENMILHNLVSLLKIMELYT